MAGRIAIPVRTERIDLTFICGSYGAGEAPLLEVKSYLLEAPTGRTTAIWRTHILLTIAFL